MRDPILLVGEDDAFAMYAEFLQHRGLDTFLSTSPAEALAQLSTLRPAIVVSELAFGGDLQAGCEFMTAVRSHAATSTTILIVVTGYARKADAALARRCGAHRFFLKPLLPASLLQEIESVFAHLKEGRQPVWNGPSGAWDRRLRRRSTDGER